MEARPPGKLPLLLKDASVPLCNRCRDRRVEPPVPRTGLGSDRGSTLGLATILTALPDSS